VKEYLIYWGTGWSSAIPSETTINNAATALFASNYFKGLKQYSSSISGNVTLAGTWTDAAAPPSMFNYAQLEAVVNAAINANGWALTTTAATAPIFMVITLPGTSSFNQPGAAGFHISAPDGSNELIYGWTTDPNNGTPFSVMADLSHETVESITDPLGNVGMTGITETASSSIDWFLASRGFSTTFGELADFEPELAAAGDVEEILGGSATYWAQAYWSNADQAYIVEV
jgi:hypothetical protein